MGEKGGGLEVVFSLSLFLSLSLSLSLSLLYSPPPLYVSPRGLPLFGRRVGREGRVGSEEGLFLRLSFSPEIPSLRHPSSFRRSGLGQRGRATDGRSSGSERRGLFLQPSRSREEIGMGEEDLKKRKRGEMTIRRSN